jgi:hypothetical protein
MLEKGSIRKELFFFSLFLQLSFLSLISIPPAYFAFYVQSCRGHFFAGVFQICEKVDGKWRHMDWPSPAYQIGLCFLQFFFATDCLCAVLTNVGAIYFLIFGTQQICKKLK